MQLKSVNEGPDPKSLKSKTVSQLARKPFNDIPDFQARQNHRMHKNGSPRDQRTGLNDFLFRLPLANYLLTSCIA